MPWEGKPKWSGEYASFGPVEGKLFPTVLGEPFVIAIEGSNDMFFMLFSSEEKLRDTTNKFLKKLGMAEDSFTIGQVLNDDFIDALIGYKIRFMCDPVVVDDHHTKWVEIVRQGDIYKYVESENGASS